MTGASHISEEPFHMKVFKSVLSGVALVLGVMTVAAAMPDIARYIRISRI